MSQKMNCKTCNNTIEGTIRKQFCGLNCRVKYHRTVTERTKTVTQTERTVTENVTELPLCPHCTYPLKIENGLFAHVYPESEWKPPEPCLSYHKALRYGYLLNGAKVWENGG